MPARIDVPPGTVFGHLTVIEETRLADGRRAMLCRCGCGTTRSVSTSSLFNGTTNSCGCGNMGAVIPPGTVFGRLTVIEETRLPDGRRAMICRCECGKTKTVAVSALSSGDTKSCGCGNRRVVVPPGTVFGRLTVIEEAPLQKDWRRAMLCVCECGSQVVVQLTSLSQGHSRSCGCARSTRNSHNFKDRTGERYGRLVVVRYLGTRRQGTGASRRQGIVTDWLCRCDCGGERIATGSSLSTGHTTSCGCAKCKPHPGQAARNRVLNAYLWGARGRNLKWELTDEEFDRLVTQNCAYCGCEPSMIEKGVHPSSGDFIHGGIDRVDSAQGYVIANVVPCCTICNHAKMAMSHAEFMTWIGRLVSFRARRRKPEKGPQAQATTLF
jgi:hypothetical protein